MQRRSAGADPGISNIEGAQKIMRQRPHPEREVSYGIELVLDALFLSLSHVI